MRYSFIPNLEAGDLLESFLVSAVAAILLLRLYLHLTGYPQVGGAHLHIAHVLYGGLLMGVAILMVLNFLDRRAHAIAAVLGGVGFGVFIDELGKFITRDVNYFYKPAVAIIYVIFVLLYLAILRLTRHGRVSHQAYLVNVMRSLKEATLRDDPSHQLALARRYLAAAEPSDPLCGALREVVEDLGEVAPTSRSRLAALEHRVRALYRYLMGRPHVQAIVLGLFILHAVASMAQAVAVTAGETHTIDPISFASRLPETPFIKYGDVVFSLLADVLVAIGVLVYGGARMLAYGLFKASILVTIFLTDFFVFYAVQFNALWGFALDLLFLGMVNYLLRQERFRALDEDHEREASAAEAS